MGTWPSNYLMLFTTNTYSVLYESCAGQMVGLN